MANKLMDPKNRMARIKVVAPLGAKSGNNKRNTTWRAASNKLMKNKSVPEKLRMVKGV